MPLVPHVQYNQQLQLLCDYLPFEQNKNHPDIEITESGEMPIGSVAVIKMSGNEKQLQHFLYYSSIIDDALSSLSFNKKNSRNPSVVLEHTDDPNINNINISHGTTKPFEHISIDKRKETSIVEIHIDLNQITLGAQFIYFILEAGEKIDFTFYGKKMNFKYIQ